MLCRGRWTGKDFSASLEMTMKDSVRRMNPDNQPLTESPFPKNQERILLNFLSLKGKAPQGSCFLAEARKTEEGQMMPSREALWSISETLRTPILA